MQQEDPSINRRDIARRSRNPSGAPVCNRLGTTHRARPVGNRRSTWVAASPRYASAVYHSQDVRRDTKVVVSSLTAGLDYYFVVDSFNHSGVSFGKNAVGWR